MKLLRNKKRSRKRGVSAVELIVSLPVLMGIMALTMDLGHLSFINYRVNQIAYQAIKVASHATDDKTDTSDPCLTPAEGSRCLKNVIEDRAYELLASHGIPVSSVDYFQRLEPNPWAPTHEVVGVEIVVTHDTLASKFLGNAKSGISLQVYRVEAGTVYKLI